MASTTRGNKQSMKIGKKTIFTGIDGALKSIEAAKRVAWKDVYIPEDLGKKIKVTTDKNGKILITPKNKKRMAKKPEMASGLVTLTTPLEFDVVHGKYMFRMKNKSVTWDEEFMSTKEIEVIKNFIEDVYRMGFSDGSQIALNSSSNNEEYEKLLKCYRRLRKHHNKICEKYNVPMAQLDETIS